MNRTTEDPGTDAAEPHHRQVEHYGGDDLQVRHGRVNRWLLLVYLALFLWALYYEYRYWGGLGPGLEW
jgi:hypothetical protein